LTTLLAVEAFETAGVLFAPGKTSNAGGPPPRAIYIKIL
jgi:glutamate dehydrogenase/leucine dehydrogenase